MNKIRYFKILDWQKWYPHNYYSIPWIKLSSNIFNHPIFVAEKPIFLFTFIYFLSCAAKENKNGAFLIHTTSARHSTGHYHDIHWTLSLTFLLNNELIQELTPESYRGFAPKKKEVRSKKKETAEEGSDEFSENQKKEQPKYSNKDGLRAGALAEGLMLMWNETPNLLPIKTVTTHRRKLAQAAFEELPNLEAWKSIFNKVSLNSFMTGGGKLGWQADFDWVLTKGNWARIADGSFDDKLNLPWVPKEER